MSGCARPVLGSLLHDSRKRWPIVAQVIGIEYFSNISNKDGKFFLVLIPLSISGMGFPYL
jgi:hypothetical protein